MEVAIMDKTKEKQSRNKLKIIVGISILLLILLLLFVAVYLPIRKERIINSYTRDKILYDITENREKILAEIGHYENYGEFYDVELVAFDVELEKNYVDIEIIAKYHQNMCYLLVSNTITYNVDDEDYFEVNFSTNLHDAEVVYVSEPFMSPREIEEIIRSKGFYSDYEITACDCIAAPRKNWRSPAGYEEIESFEKLEYYVQFGVCGNDISEVEYAFVQVYWNSDIDDWDVDFSQTSKYCECDYGIKSYIPVTRYLTDEEKDKICYWEYTIYGD